MFVSGQPGWHRLSIDHCCNCDQHAEQWAAYSRQRRSFLHLLFLGDDYRQEGASHGTQQWRHPWLALSLWSTSVAGRTVVRVDILHRRTMLERALPRPSWVQSPPQGAQTPLSNSGYVCALLCKCVSRACASEQRKHAVSLSHSRCYHISRPRSVSTCDPVSLLPSLFSHTVSIC